MMRLISIVSLSNFRMCIAQNWRKKSSHRKKSFLCPISLDDSKVHSSKYEDICKVNFYRGVAEESFQILLMLFQKYIYGIYVC